MKKYLWLVVVAIAVVALVGFLLFYKSPTVGEKTPSVTTVATFNPATLRVGDMVGNFRTIKNGPFQLNTDVTPNQESVFEGLLTTTVVYNWSDFGEYYVDHIPEDVQKEIPYTSETWKSYCVSSSDEKLFTEAGVKSGDGARITFDQVIIINYPSDGCFPSLHIIKVEKL